MRRNAPIQSADPHITAHMHDEWRQIAEVKTWISWLQVPIEE